MLRVGHKVPACLLRSLPACKDSKSMKWLLDWKSLVATQQNVFPYQPSVSIFTNPTSRIRTPIDGNVTTTFGYARSVLDNIVKKTELEPNSPEQLADALKFIAIEQYRKLVSTIPWLQANSNLAYIQLVLKDDLQKYMSPVTSSDQFQILCEQIESNIDSLTPKQRIESFLCLLYMGYDPTSSLIHQLLFKTKADIDDHDWYCLSVMSTVNKALQRHDPKLNYLITRRHSVLMDNGGCASKDDLYAHCLVLLNTIRFYSPTLVNKAAQTMVSSLNLVESDTLSGEELSTLVHVSTILNTHINSTNDIAGKQIMESVFPVFSAIHRNMNKFDPIHLRQVKRNLAILRQYNPELRRRFDERVEELLIEYRDNMKLDIAANLVCVFSKGTNKDLVRHLESILYNHLKSHEIDIVTLSHIAQALAEIDSVNTDLILLLQDLIIENADNLIYYVTRFQKIFRFLIMKQFINPENKLKIADIIVQSMSEGQYGFSSQNISKTMAVLIPNTSEALPQVLMHKLLSAIPKWSQKSLHHFICGLNSLRHHKLSRELKQQIVQIYSLLYVTVLESKDAIQSFYNLNLLTDGFVIRNQQQDPEVTELLMDLHLDHADHVTGDELSVMMTNCFKTKYFNEDLFETFVDSVLKQPESEKTRCHMRKLMSVLGMAGYEPKKFDLLLPLVKKCMASDLEAGNLRGWLFFLHQLVILEHFMEEDLCKLFTLEFLEKVDKYCEENPNTLKQIEGLVSDLNRSCIIECPRIEVPWFSERYMKHQFQTVLQEKKGTPSWILHNEIEEVLRLVLGGSDNYKRCTPSPYYHAIGFECLMDSAKRVLPWTSISSTKKSNVQRVAVQIIKESNCTFNTRKLVGLAALYLRQLEIVGYHVVQVPHYEWNSMGMADQKAKRDYLRKKIFDF